MVSSHNMKSLKRIRKITTGLLAAGLIAQANGDIPRKAPLTRYTGLWTNSPFTSKPPPPTGKKIDNPLEDFTLTGIAPVPGGYRITIVNKKNPGDKKIIEPGRSGDFQLVSVDRNPEVSLGTTVVLSADGIQGTVSFEPELITPKSSPVTATPQPGQTAQQLPPGANPAQPRLIRPRIVGPSTPPNASQGNSP